MMLDVERRRRYSFIVRLQRHGGGASARWNGTVELVPPDGGTAESQPPGRLRFAALAELPGLIGRLIERAGGAH